MHVRQRVCRYAKAECQRKRKMGHVNIVASSRAEACRRLEDIAPGASASPVHWKCHQRYAVKLNAVGTT